MAHMEPMDVDSISNDFDDKENSLQNSNVLPRTPSTEKGYEELDVSELNMKLRYSMTPATSPMSRSFTANCRDNKVCDNENNSIIFNDNSNLSHSFNSTITDSIFKSSKLPLQVLPTEQFVDDNGNPIVRSLDVECNNVTITVNGTDNIDDNLSLPSTSSSLTHTPEATTPTKEIAKDGGSPIMRGLKSVLNMFRSSQSPIPSDDITTNDLTSFESPKKESSNFTTNLGSSPTTTNKNKENNISKTNTPLKESLVFNEDLEKELLWKDETTILFKEEKIPIYKLFFPPNSAALESINSKPIEKENINTTVEYTDGSNETVNAYKDMNEEVKLSSLETETFNGPESDSEFVDCETSYTKNDTRILDNNIPTLSPIIKNISPEFSITDGNKFQLNEISEDEHSLSIVADTNFTDQTKAIISNTEGVIKEGDIDENFEHTHNDLSILKESRDQHNILSNSLKEDIPNDLADKCNTIAYENTNELVQCSNETFNLEVSEVSQIDQEYKNDIVNTSHIVDNDATLSEEGKEDFKESYPSQITKEIEDICSGDRVCDFDSTIALNELTFKTQTDDLEINNIELPLDSQDVNVEEIDFSVLQDTNKNKVTPLVKTEKSFNVDNKINVKLDSEIIEDTILKQKHNNENETVILSDQIIQLEAKEIKTISNNLPSDIPLPYDSDIDKDMNEENLIENDKSVNISSNNLNFDLSHSTESIKQTIDITSLTEIIPEALLNPAINNAVASISVIQTPELESSEDMSNIKKYITANESNVLEINNVEKCLPKVKDTKDMSCTVMNSVTSSNSNYSEGGVDLGVLTYHTQDNKNAISENHVESVARKSTDNENKTSVIGMEFDVSRHDSENSENSFETKNNLTESLEVQRSESVIGDKFLQNHVEIVETSKSTDNENETSVIGMELDVSKYDSEDSENPFTTKNKLTESLEVQHSESVIGEGFVQNHVESVQTIKSTDNENETSVIGMELDVSRHDSEDNENPFTTKNKLTESLEVQHSESVIGEGFVQNHVESVQTIKSRDNENETSVIGMELDVSKHDSEHSENPFETKNKLTTSLEVQRSESVIEDGFLQNHVEIVPTNKSTDNENETSVIGMELDVSRHDLEDSENPFETKNNLTESLEVQHSDSVIGDGILPNYIEIVPQAADDKNYITNEMDARVKYNEVDIPITNRNIAGIGMDLEVPKHESENGVIPGPENYIAGGASKKIIDGVDTFLNDKNEISIIPDGKIKEEANLPSTFNNSLITEMELDVSKPDLEDVSKVSRNSIETENQLKSSLEKKGRKSVIENISVDECYVLRNEIDFKINEVINIPTDSNNSVTESGLDVLKHDLVSENINIKDGEIMNNSFKTITRLTDKIMELKSKSNVTINDELIVPLTKVISSEVDLGVPKHDEENIETTFKTKSIITPSPQISSKCTQDGYNIDFDKIDDPFSTKTNSATSNINKEDFINTETNKTITEYQLRPEPNRRKTLQDQNNSVTNEGANTSFGIINSRLENRVQEIYVKDDKKPDIIEKNTNSALFSSDKLQDDTEINTPGDCTVLGQTENFVEEADINLSNQISSSSKMYESKNVFNLPEIGDMNFKPFTTTSYINDNEKTSSGVCCNPLERTTIESGKDEAEKKNVQDLESNLSPNLSNVTCSSKNADEITSLREVNTEDEDTVEGPFLEAEDFSNIVKVSDFETQKDMMNFEDLPTRTTDDNDNGEFFIDAETFEFLLNQNKSNVVADSGKESLFLKFDPLFAKRISSDGVLTALKKIQKRQSTPKKMTPLKIMQEENPTPGPSTPTPIGVAAPVATDIVEEPVAAMSKPMMVVNPAVASFVSPRKSTTPPRVNRRSLTFTSPAMAVIDRLLSLSGNSSNLDQDSSLPINREYNETDFALTQLRELLADKEIHVHNLRSESKELKERFAILESQVRSLETESEERLRKVKELNDNLAEKNKINKSMAIVVEEYERTIASLIAEMEQERKHNAEERMKLISERDEQTAHLASMEVSFSDLHSKYEKSKQIILSMKANEDTYKKSLNEFEVNLLKMQTNYDLLKQHATSKLNHANQELEKYNRAHDAEVVKLNAMIKRKELQITSLEESLSQKTKANEELTAICDELINKVG